MMVKSMNSVDGRAGVHSREWMRRAKQCIPGGVNSPVRAFSSVGGEPPFISKAEGCEIETLDGVRLIDYVGTWGPAILGHAHPEVVEAVCRAAKNGLSFGASTRAEVEFAELICDAVPSLRNGLVRLVSSGTEATMSALRTARGFTGRSKIVKFDGGYHGHDDKLLVAAGSGAATLGIPGSAGVAPGAVVDTLVLPYNDLDAAKELFSVSGEIIAALIIEPVAGNMGCIPPLPGYLAELRKLTAQYGALLIFDEVMTGFRLAYGGAQERFDVTPDMTCLGKIVGGGMPVGAYGGRREIMEKVAPLGPVYQAGTLSGNPLSVAAGMATLNILRRDSPYLLLESTTATIAEGIDAAAKRYRIPWASNRVASMFCGFFQNGPVSNYEDAKNSDLEQFSHWHQAMLKNGIYLAPSQFEAGFVSIAHDSAAIEKTLDAADSAFAEIAKAG